ncbi:MAG: ComF family protein [Eggerthellaceae bacterium]|jgi:predicted amidophosphoribosyltransferase|nr:ComF family protein [Eggerthellaceae bacterium]
MMSRTPHSTHLRSAARAYTHSLAEVFAESIWPTRCALCDKPGAVLCETCRLNLPYIDYWKACVRCGAPLGKIQCSECNPVTLQQLGEKAPPFARCVCVSEFNGASSAIVTTYKDRGERRLADEIACMLAEVIPPEWFHGCSISFIPATRRALRRRGFDHAELLAEKLAQRMDSSSVALFDPPDNKDQRTLSRSLRFANMDESIRLKEGLLLGKALPQEVLLVDDVYTTGVSLITACKALQNAGVENVYCATFARVW